MRCKNTVKKSHRGFVSYQKRLKINQIISILNKCARIDGTARNDAGDLLFPPA
jgi:hypothetical protein